MDDAAGSLVDRIISFIVNFKRRADCQRNYLQSRIRNCQSMMMEWINDPHFRLNLEEIYIPLQLQEDCPNGERGGIYDFLEVLKEKRRIVIQGGPGSGKSTLMNYTTLQMSSALRNVPKYANLKERALFPIQVHLYKYTDGIKINDLLREALSNYKRDESDELLQNPKNKFLLIFDGLDEIDGIENRRRAITEIIEVSQNYVNWNVDNRIIVTTRPSGYSHKAMRGFDLYSIKDFNMAQQTELVRAYFRAWDSRDRKERQKENWEIRADHLLAELEKNTLPQMKLIITNPLMLSLVAWIYYSREGLTSSRHELLESCLETLVMRHSWNEYEGNQDSLPEKTEDKLVFISEIALYLMEKPEKSEWFSYQEADDILKTAKQTYPYLHLELSELQKILETAEYDWGILIRSSRDRRFRFANELLQEYLVARLISSHPGQHISKIIDHAWDSSWDEIIKMFVTTPYNQPVSEEPDTEPLDPGSQQKKRMEEQVSSVDVMLYATLSERRLTNIERQLRAGMLLANRGSQRAQLYTNISTKVIEDLKKLVFGNQPETLRAFEILCQIEPEGISFILELLYLQEYAPYQHRTLDWLSKMSDLEAIQALRMAIITAINPSDPGSTYESLAYTQDQILIFSDVLGRIGDSRLGLMSRPMQIKGQKPFRVGRFPVTNSEYWQYVEDARAPAPSHWVNGEFPIQMANHPVVNVTFYEAVEYCVWKSEKAGRIYRLPSVAEWMYAGQDGLDRDFPWGNRYDPNMLNAGGPDDGEIHTTPVGIYSGGRTTNLQIYDMLGNVWEWTSDRALNQCILKGGSWRTQHSDLRREKISIELNLPPKNCRDDVGFRVIQIEE